jgi:hypothetical protein
LGCGDGGERDVRLALLLAAAVILIRDPTGKWADDPLQPWFQSLQNKYGLSCCAEADGHPLNDGEWDIKDDHYRVFLEGEWIVVPDDAVILGPNKFGNAIVWLRKDAHIASGEMYDITRIHCFIPGSGV